MIPVRSSNFRPASDGSASGGDARRLHQRDGRRSFQERDRRAGEPIAEALAFDAVDELQVRQQPRDFRRLDVAAQRHPPTAALGALRGNRRPTQLIFLSEVLINV